MKGVCRNPEADDNESTNGVGLANFRGRKEKKQPAAARS